MKVLQVVRQFHPSVGGVERAVMALCHRLHRRGHECEIVTLRRLWSDPRLLPATEVVNGLRVDRIPCVGGRRFFLAPDVLRWTPGQAIIHVHAIDFFVDFLAATKWHHRTPLVVSTHGGFFHTGWAMPAKRAYFRTITRLALSQASRVICVSAQDDRLFAPIVPARKRVTISNGVEEAFFSVEKSVDPGLLITIGRLAEHKGIDRVIALLPRIRRDVPQARLVVVGPDSGGRRASLEAEARARGVADRVSFTGEVTAEVLAAHLSRAHLVLAPSAYEGFGIAVVEAMAAGNVVIASDIDAHRELIAPGVDGVLVDFGDEARACRAVVEGLRLPPGRAREMGDLARGAVSRFSWERIVDDVERVYEESAARGVAC